MAPFLFIIALDYVLVLTSQNNFGFTTHLNPEIKLTDLDFADDISLLDGSISQATDHIPELRHNSDVVGLKNNFDKTKFMSNYPTQNEIQLADGSSI